MWKPIKDSLNYLSDDNNYIAIYKHSFAGVACYWVFSVTEKKRMQKNAIAIGGLPSKQLMDRIKSGD